MGDGQWNCSFAINSVSVNGKTLDETQYSVHDYVLTIDASCFDVGENSVTINDSVSFNVTVINNTQPIGPSSKSGCGGNIITTSIVFSSLSLLLAVAFIIAKKRRA